MKQFCRGDLLQFKSDPWMTAWPKNVSMWGTEVEMCPDEPVMYVRRLTRDEEHIRGYDRGNDANTLILVWLHGKMCYTFRDSVVRIRRW